MIKVKDGYAKLIGTTYSGSADRVLLSNGGDKAVSDFAAASALGDYVTLATAQTITGTKTFNAGITVKGSSVYPLVVDSTNTYENGIKIQMSGVNKAWIGYTPGIGAYLYNYTGPHRIGINDSGVGFIDSNIILHSGNYTTYTVKTDGTGATGTWPINITGNSATSGRLAVIKVFDFGPNAATYCKVASINITGRYGGGTGLLKFYTNRTTSSETYFADSFEVFVHAYQQNPIGEKPVLQFKSTNTGDAYDIIGILNYSSSGSTFDIYAYGKGRSYHGLYVSLVHGDIAIAPGSYVSSLPAGTQVTPLPMGNTKLLNGFADSAFWKKTELTKVSQLTNDSGYVTGGPYLPLAGGTLSGHLSSNSGYTIVQPYGAQYNTTTSSVTGCITVVLPASIGNSMVSMWIDVYVYDKQKSFSVHCGGYTYNNSTWANHPFAMVYGANHRIRMGHNGTNFVIYIGEESTVWSYPQVSVRNVTLGYNPTIANWQKAWDVVFSTSVSNVTYDTTTYVWTTKNLTKSSIGLGNVENTAFYKRQATVNGTTWDLAGTVNSLATFTIYAPTTAGTSGQVLTSSGGTPSWTNQSSLSVNNLNRLSGGFSVSGAGWYKLAYIKSTDARGSVRLALITTGGNYTPRYTELKVSNGWSTIVFNQNGKFDWISGYRYTTDSTYSYIEAYFTGACTITLYTFSGTGYVDDSYSGWQVYSAATAGSGTVAETYDHLTSSSLYTSGNFHTPSNAYAAHFYENSDANLKKNIKEILDSDNIPVIKEFDWKSDGTHSYGLIAQELEEQGYSELVSDSGSHKTVNYSAALSLIVGKLQNKIKELEKEIENLKLRN